MSIRDLIVFAILIVGCVAALSRPWVGVMLWTWLSLMSPHKLAWGFIVHFPVAQMAALATLLGMLLTKERQFFVTRESAALIAFVLWVSLTFPLAIHPESSFEMWSRVIKIDFMILVTLVLLHSRQHIELFIWANVISIGFYGVKGGIFTILTGGQFRVWGPAGTFIEGNNELALALIMTIPLIRFLQLQVAKLWMRHGFTAAMILIIASVLGSQSRGALLAIGVMIIFLWYKSPKKLGFGIGLIALGVALLAFMPETWHSRMETIQSYEEDGSAMGRINAWWMAWNLAMDRWTGAGFTTATSTIFALYAPDPTVPRAAHSIYFQVLGAHGFIGLFSFLAIWVFTWWSAGWLVRHGGGSQETLWCRHLGAMCQVSLIGYAAGGAFLSLAYFDLPYNIMAMVVLTRRWLESHLRERETFGKNMISVNLAQ